IVPIDNAKVNIIPKCNGVIPNSVTTGNNIGVKINIAGVKSINVPTNNSRITIDNNTIIELSEIPNIVFASAFGIPVNDITHAKILEAPIKNIIIADSFALSTNTLYNPLILNDL